MFDRTISSEDRLEIQELYARYCQTADLCDGEAWADCFTEDGVFAPSLGPEAGRTYRGRKELAEFISAPHRTPSENRHWNTALTLDRNGSEIDAVCYAFLLCVAGVDRPKILGSVIYRDRLTKERGAWKFRERRPRKDG